MTGSTHQASRDAAPCHLLLVTLAWIAISTGAASAQPSPPASAPAPTSDAKPPLTPQIALEELKAGKSPSAARLTEIENAIKPAADAEPREAKWVLARALIERARGNRTPAKELATQAASLSPADADMHYWKGATIFEGIQDVGMFSKMSAADDGKAAFDQAVRLDPAHVAARMGLIQFYVNAPGIAGGSYAKAREQANAIADVPGKKVRGLLALAGIFVAEDDWTDADRVYTQAADTATTPTERAEAVRTHVYALLTKKKDADAALAKLEAAKLVPSDEDSSNFVAAEVYLAAGRWSDAIGLYEKVLSHNPQAGNCLIGLGKAQVASGKPAAAAETFERFLAAFATDSRVDAVRDLLKDAKKKAAKK